MYPLTLNESLNEQMRAADAREEATLALTLPAAKPGFWQTDNGKFLGALGVLTGFIGLGIALSANFDSHQHPDTVLAAPAAVSAPAKPAGTLHLIGSHRFTVDEAGIAHVRGTIKNSTGHACSVVTVTVRLADRSGTLVGSALDTLLEMPAGASWRFDASGVGQGATRCQVAEIRAE